MEGSRHYTLTPFSKLDVYENPNNIFFEGPSHLINDDTGEMVGVAVTESMGMPPTSIDGFNGLAC